MDTDIELTNDFGGAPVRKPEPERPQLASDLLENQLPLPMGDEEC